MTKLELYENYEILARFMGAQPKNRTQAEIDWDEEDVMKVKKFYLHTAREKMTFKYNPDEPPCASGDRTYAFSEMKYIDDHRWIMNVIEKIVREHEATLIMLPTVICIQSPIMDGIQIEHEMVDEKCRTFVRNIFYAAVKYVREYDEKTQAPPLSIMGNFTDVQHSNEEEDVEA